MATLTTVLNPFNANEKHTRTVSCVPIWELLVPYAQDIEFVVSINGEITENYEYVLRENDFLAIVPIPAGGGGGGKSIIRIVAMIALTIASQGLAAGFMGATAGMVGAGVYGGLSGALILGGLQAAIVVGGGLLINALLPTASASVATTTSLSEVSPTYSYSGGSNAREAGTTLPIMLGTARVSPPIISSYLSLEDDKQYLNILMAVNDGTVNSISDIEINSQAITNFNDISYATALGTSNQSAIGNFRDTATTISLSRGLNEQNIETTYTTVSNSIQELEVVVVLSSGLFSIADNGDYNSKSISFEIAYKKDTSSTWTTVTKTITDVYKTTKRLSYRFSNLPIGTYDVKLKRISAYDENTRVANALSLDYINEIVYDDFSYPGVALLAINAMATDQLNGSFPTVTCLVNNTGTTKNKSNPAWACYDLLNREGIPDSDINMTKFQEWADYCDTKGLKVGLYLDSQQELQSALNIVSLLGRGIVLQFGSIFTPIIDKDVDIPTQGFLFTGGNIIDSSFSISYIPYNERSNVIEVTYYDETDSYSAKTVQVQSADFDSKTVEIKSSITLYGCTSRTQASSYAQYLLNKNRYISETVSFTAFIDSIACNVGDVIKVGVKYMTNTLADGRILGVTTDSLILDHEIELSPSESYEIQIRCEDDELVTINIPNVSTLTTTDTIYIGTFPREIKKFDVYAFGQQDVEATNLYRVTSITRASDLKRKITAIEYNADVYSDAATIDVEPILLIDNTTNLKAEEILVQRTDGTVDEILVISFNSNKLVNTVYLDGVKVGTTSTNNFEIKNQLTRGKDYFITVNEKTISHRFNGLLAKVSTPSNMTINLLATNTVLSWSAVPFAAGYRISHNGIVIEEQIKSTTFNYKLLSNGIHTFTVEALNIALEPGDAIEQSIEVEVPLSPNVSISYKGENAIIEWEESNSTYPILHYKIVHDELTTLAKTTTYSTKVTWATNTISIQAVDVANNVSTIRTVQSEIIFPTVNEVTSSVIDNNVLLYWKQSAKTLPIAYVEIKKGETIEESTLIGTNSSTFANLFESQSDYYTYWVVPVDTAGNKGTPLSTTALVNEPPDYVLNALWLSDFSGTKNNAFVEASKLYLGIKNETFEDHFITNTWANPQEQINAGYPLYAQPFAASSYYEEIFDYGTLLPSTTVTVTLDYTRVGAGGFQIDIASSDDGLTWVEHTDVSKITSSNFRYIKVKVSFVGSENDAFIVNILEVKLDSKVKNDSGKAYASASDTQGTQINFNKSFIDVINLTITPIGTTRKDFVCDFEDTDYPTYFKVYMFDTLGNRINSDFTWSAEGY
jgi:predicted phage tail protein